MKTQKGISTIAGITIFVVVAVFAFGGVFAYEYYLEKNEQKAEGNQNTEPTACTMEAKLCPDGSSVGRSGPNCEFTECPDQTAGWKTYTNAQYGFEFKYPSDLTLKNANLIYGCNDNLNGYGAYLENVEYGEVLNILVTCGTINTTSGIPIHQVMIGNKSGYEYTSKVYTGTSSQPVEIPGALAMRDMVDLGNGRFIQIDFDNQHAPLDYVNQIISTFKFIK